MDFRFLTPTDVDRFIQLPDTLQVDARSIVLTVEEDTLQEYDHYFKITDYVIYCELLKSKFFNAGMDWKYKIVQRVDASNNQYMGPHVEDGHSSSTTEVSNDIINTTLAIPELSVDTASTRYVHYKQCNRFFKYSFKVGDQQDVPVYDASGNAVLDNASSPITRKAQLYAVYLDSTDGFALPYWSTTDGSGNSQVGEEREFYYMDTYDSGTAVATLLTAINNNVPIEDTELETSAVTINVVCPPDPEFVDQKDTVRGGNLALTITSGSLDIRQVGDQDGSGNLTTYTQTNFVRYSDATDNRALMLYWVVNPQDDRQYMGEEMYVAWCSHDVRPMRDLVDASGAVIKPQGGATMREIDRFTLGRTVVADSEYYNVYNSLRPLAPLTAAPRLYLPVSKFIVMHEQPNESDVLTGGQDEFDVPFAYEIANSTDFGGEPKKAIVGGRVMQLVSQYLFDDATNKEMSYFPFLLNESKQLTEKIITALANKIKEPASSVGNSRTEILKQILIKHGRRYFEEYATMDLQENEEDHANYGNVWDVLDRINEMFLFFTVAIKTTVSNRTKDDVEIIRLVDVPVVVRVYE